MVCEMSQATDVRFETLFLSKNPPRDERIDQLVYWCQRFDKLGLAPRSAGNLSFRTKQGFIITATGLELRAVKKGDLVEVVKVETDNKQTLVYVKGRMVPSKESVLHSSIYDLRSKINAVFHTHDQLVVELADELKLPCTEGEQPRGSHELVKEVQRMLRLMKDVRYLVLRNHGVIAMGETMETAGSLAEDMNRMARDFAQRKEGRK